MCSSDLTATTEIYTLSLHDALPIREARLPDGVIVGAIVRGSEVIIPRGDTVTRPNDLVVIFARSEAVKKVEKLFAVKLEFF